MGCISYQIKLPISNQGVWNALDEVEKRGKEIWNDTHGCDDCDMEHPEYGTQMINPNCKACEGEGIII